MDSDATVRDVITREYVGVSESDTVQGAVQLMRDERASSVIVLRGNDPVGIVTEWDVLGLVADDEDVGSTTAGDVMSSPVESVETDVPLTEAAGRMSGESIRNLLVEEEGEVVGVLTDRDIIAAMASLQRTRDREVAGVSQGTSREPAEANGGSTPNTAGTTTTAGGSDGAAYVTQGVCEVCGSLSETLYDTNGQLVCPDCREM